jgi:hypothetical protein
MDDKVMNYIDRVKSELYYCLEEFHQMDVRSQQDALDIAVKLYYLQTITNDLIEDLRKGGDK